MEFETKPFNPHSRQTNIITRISDVELTQMARNIEMHIVRRVIDTLYTELLPTLREQVLSELSAAKLAEILTGEISLAIKGALNPGSK